VRPDPGGRAFLALLACARDGCSATRFSEYLSLGQAPPPDAAPPEDQLPVEDELLASFSGAVEVPRSPAPSHPATDTDPVIEGTLQSPIGWEALLVDAAVIGGADRWERRLRGLESELKVQLNELDENTAAYTRLMDRIQRLKN